MVAGDESKVPVTVLTGFLGSGKTTLMNRILADPSHGMRFAIIENEFGEVGVDDKLLVSGASKQTTDEEVIEVMNGCICCTVRGDLVEALKRLHQKVKKFDAVLIETTGMADPAPVAQTFFVDEEIQRLYRLDGIVTVVDAAHIEQHLDKEVKEGAENESVEQLAFADIVILNKCDLATRIGGATALTNAAEDCADTTEAAKPRQLGDNPTFAEFKTEAIVPAEAEETLKRIESRIRGVNPHAPIMRTSFSKIDPSKLLNVRSFDLDRALEMDPGFLDVDAEHEHDDSVSSVAWQMKGLELSMNKMQNWISALMRDLGTELYRYKGVLAIKGSKAKFVFQGVHMMFGGDFSDDPVDGVWKDDEERECRFVFIGKQVKQKYAESLKAGFMACEADKLRFALGDFVAARTGKGWRKAKVIKLWDDMNPYRLEVQDERRTNVWGPMDKDDCVRAWVDPAKQGA